MIVLISLPNRINKTKISRNLTKNELYKSEKDNILKVCSKQQHERKKEGSYHDRSCDNNRIDEKVILRFT